MSSGKEKRPYDRGFSAGLRRAILLVLGEACESCGTKDLRVLDIDHVFGGGTQHRKLLSGSGYYRSILRRVRRGEFALLCANCHKLKRRKAA